MKLKNRQLPVIYKIYINGGFLNGSLIDKNGCCGTRNLKVRHNKSRHLIYVSAFIMLYVLLSQSYEIAYLRSRRIRMHIVHFIQSFQTNSEFLRNAVH